MLHPGSNDRRNGHGQQSADASRGDIQSQCQRHFPSLKPFHDSFSGGNADRFHPDAENRIKQNGGEILILSTEFYDKISGDLKDYSDYPEKVCDDLTKIASQLTSQEITTAQALEKINDVKEDFSVLYDNMSGISASDNDDKSLTLLANASVAMSALEYLCDTTVSRPNLVCDIRYTVCRIIFTYCYSE